MTLTDEQLGAAVDALITARQNGQSHHPVPLEVTEEVVLADQLLALAEQMQPDDVKLPTVSAQPISLSGNHRRPTRNWLRVPRENRPMPRAILGLRQVALSALVLLALASAILISPGARALAQDILQFFQRSESDTIEVRLTPISTSPLPQPTDAPTTAEVPPVLTPEENVIEVTRVEPTPTLEGPLTLDEDFPLTLDEAATEAGFPTRAPTSLPEGFEFRGTRYDANRQAIEQYYVFASHTGEVVTPQFTLIQQPGPFDSLIGPSATIDPVTIGDIPGEYVAGGWLYKPSGTQVEADGTIVQQFTWERTMVPLQTLRWAKDGFYFEIAFIGSDTHDGFVAQEALVLIAASVR
ncbi:MAG: hypothetical protein IT318_08400 [Anaerolineales bacterium]|nr:hypothetical protein [Anaerolineales bacterium]